MARKTPAEKATDRRIDIAYRESCANIAIPLLSIPKVFEVGRKAIDAGATEWELREFIAKLVVSIADKSTLNRFAQCTALTWMRQHRAEHVDPTTNEVNCTSIAEACAHEFGENEEGGPLDDDSHWIWELALYIAESP